MDASHLMGVANRCYDHDIRSLAVVHDIQILTPQVFAGLINAPAFLSRLGNEHGVSSLETLLKTEEQMAQEQQQAMAQQAMQAATPAIAEAAIGAATQDPNQGT